VDLDVEVAQVVLMGHSLDAGNTVAHGQGIAATV
jgi:hypothetical protein